MTGLETKFLPFSEGSEPRTRSVAPKRKASTVSDRQSAKPEVFVRTFPSRRLVARARLPLEYQEVTTHTHTTHTPSLSAKRPKGPKREPKASSLTRPRMHTHAYTRTHTHTPTRIMHFCLTWPLTASTAFWPLVMIDVNVTHSLLPTAIAHCQLPIDRLALLGPLLYKSRFNGYMHSTSSNPVLWSMSFMFMFFFLFPFLRPSFFPDASVYCTLHPSTQDQQKAHPPVGLMHLCMSWKIPLTGYEISEIATKHPEARSQKSDAKTPEEATSQDAATHSRTRTHTHTLTPPPGPLGGPLPSPALPSSPSRPEYRYFGSLLYLTVSSCKTSKQQGSTAGPRKRRM